MMQLLIRRGLMLGAREIINMSLLGQAIPQDFGCLYTGIQYATIACGILWNTNQDALKQVFSFLILDCLLNQNLFKSPLTFPS
jgi:hypothetical protein